MATEPWIQAGGGFLTGLAAGYALKKGFKVILFIIGVLFIAIIALEHYDIVTLHEAALKDSMDTLSFRAQEAFVALKTRLEHMHTMHAAGLLSGFILGLKIA